MCGLDPAVVERHELELSGDFGERYELEALAARGRHHGELAARHSVSRHRTQPGRQQPVGRARDAAALYVAEDRHPTLQPGGRLELACQLERVLALSIDHVSQVGPRGTLPLARLRRL